MRVKNIDRIIILLFYFSIVIGFYYSSLSQSNGQERFFTPLPFLILPFGIAFLQLFRIVIMMGGGKMCTLGKSWLFILLYYLFAFIISYNYGINQFKYNTYWFVVCPPLSWIYYSIILKENSSISDLLIKWSFWILVLLSVISIYFIPRSVNDRGFFSALNTGYYVLFAYPMVLLDRSKMKRIIATFLMVLIVLFSLKRGGIVSVALAFTLYILLSSKVKIINKIIIIVLFTGVLGYLLPWIDTMTSGTLTARYEFTQNGGDEDGRVAMYPMIWNAIGQSSPFEIVLGHGHNAVSSNRVLYGLTAHNDYLEFFYDYGLVGLSLLIIYQIRLFVITKKCRNSNKNYLPSLFALTSIVVLSMVSIVYAYQYFLLIIPFWCVLNNKVTTKKKHI